ncbi:hypothetical protein AAAC51_00825 [Priestia megaterium]
MSRQDFYYLQLAQQLLGHSSYELISMKADASELWFQSSHRKDKSIVRIVRRNFKSAVEQQKMYCMHYKELRICESKEVNQRLLLTRFTLLILILFIQSSP